MSLPPDSLTSRNSTEIPLDRDAPGKRRIGPRHYLRLIGVVLFIYILWRMDLGKVFEAVERLADPRISLAVALLLLHFFIRTFRWKIIVSSFGVRQVWGRTIREMGRAYFFGAITPARLGEAVRFQDIYRKSRSLATGAFSLVLEKGLDLLVISLIISLYSLWRGWGILFGIGTLSFALTLSLSIMIFYFPKGIRWLEETIRHRLPIGGGAGGAFRAPSPGGVCASAGLTFATWGLYAAIIHFMSGLLGIISTGFLDTLFIVCGASLSAAVPLTVAGLGIREMVVIEFGRSQEMPAELSVALSLLFLFVYMVNMILGSLFMLAEIVSDKSE
jgi:uncharacterized membrane protein YbhN (UPF0104 family)